MSQQIETGRPSIGAPNFGMDLVTLGCGILVCVFVPVVLLVSAFDAPPDDMRSIMEFARSALRGLAALLQA